MMVELFIHIRPIVLTPDDVISFLNAHMSILIMVLLYHLLLQVTRDVQPNHWI